MRGKFTFATRKSPLALAQSRAFVAKLKAAHPGVEIDELQIVTSGDKIQDRPLNEIGGKGLFVKEIEEALLDGRADFAVHSSKDVPPDLAPGLSVECFPERVDPRDVLITAAGTPLEALAKGSRIGTTSLRRRVQLAALRPDLEFVPLRGNVDTRLRKCREGQVDAIVLARAGLLRLELDAGAVEVLDVTRSLPAVGQGALAIEQRTGDAEVSALLAPLSHPDTKIAVSAERGVMRAVEGDCRTPVAAYAERRGGELWLRALLAEPDGTNLRRAESLTVWPDSPALAEELGEKLGKKLRSIAP